MKTLLKILFCIILPLAGYSQQPIQFYKLTADSVLKIYFDSQVQQKILCDLVSINNEEGATRLYYNDNKDRKVRFKTLVFKYSLYSIVLKDKLIFYVGIDEHNTVTRDSSIIKRVPECIRRNWPCNLLNSEEAKIIAIKDSIEYPDNLSYSLELNKIDKEYYWVITGYKKEASNTGKSKVPVLRASTVTNPMRRYIHARTGNIAPNDQFTNDW